MASIIKHGSIILFFAALLFVTHYLRFRGFGFYMDDSVYFYENMGRMSLSKLLDNFFYSLQTVARNMQGRIFTSTVFDIATFIAAKTSKTLSIDILYFIGFLWLWLNAYLLFILLKLRVPVFIAVLASSFYITYTPHAAKFYLTGSYVWGMANCFILASWILYLKERKIFSYI